MPASSDRRTALPAGPVASAVAEQLARIAAHDGVYRCFVTMLADEAMTAARELDRAEGVRGPLHGMTVAIKDNIDVAGVPTTAASPAMAGNVGTADATIVARLRRAGAVVIGKANLHEWAIGPTGQAPRPRGGQCLEPGPYLGRFVERIGGGRRRRLRRCGDRQRYRRLGAVAGLVQRNHWSCDRTIGLVSNHGSFPSVPASTRWGRWLRTALDVARLSQAIAGHDPRDPFSADRAPDDYVSGIGTAVGRPSIGVPRNWFSTRSRPR